MPNVSELVRLDEEKRENLEELYKVLKNPHASKNAKELALRVIRVFEEELGIEGKNYNES